MFTLSFTFGLFLLSSLITKFSLFYFFLIQSMKGIENQQRAGIFRSLKKLFKTVICIRFYNSFQRRCSFADQVRTQYRFLQVIEILVLGVTILEGMKRTEYLTKLGQRSEILKLKIQKNETLTSKVRKSWWRQYETFDSFFKFNTDSHFFKWEFKVLHRTIFQIALHSAPSCLLVIPATHCLNAYKSHITSHVSLINNSDQVVGLFLDNNSNQSCLQSTQTKPFSHRRHHCFYNQFYLNRSKNKFYDRKTQYHIYAYHTHIFLHPASASVTHSQHNYDVPVPIYTDTSASDYTTIVSQNRIH